MELFERLLSSIDKVDGHWLWNKALTWNGYGILNVAGKLQRAHTMSYQEFVGPIPTGLCVLHSNECIKHRNCINPAHLYLGDRRDNSKDCFTTGGRGRSHLSDNDVVAIRLDTREYHTIASDYGVTAQAVSQIKHGHAWNELTQNIPAAISKQARQPRGNIGGRGSSKLSDQDVLDIRASSLSKRELALKYGLQKQSVAHILKRHTFKNI